MTKISPCLWYDGTAEEAATFYPATFPDPSVDAVHRAPGDYPSGSQDDVLTVEFTVLGMHFVGLNGGPNFSFDEAVSFQVYTDTQEGSLLERDHHRRRRRKHVRLVQVQMEPFLADHPARIDGCDLQPR